MRAPLLSLWYLPETLKLYITQVVAEPAVGDRKPEASLNRQVLNPSFPYEGPAGAQVLLTCRRCVPTEHVTDLLGWCQRNFTPELPVLADIRCF